MPWVALSMPKEATEQSEMQKHECDVVFGVFRSTAGLRERLIALRGVVVRAGGHRDELDASWTNSFRLSNLAGAVTVDPLYSAVCRQLYCASVRLAQCVGCGGCGRRYSLYVLGLVRTSVNPLSVT